MTHVCMHMYQSNSLLHPAERRSKHNLSKGSVRVHKRKNVFTACTFVSLQAQVKICIVLSS